MSTLCQIPAGTPVLVTGATGFTGAVLVKKLTAAGLHVRAIRRGTSSVETLKDLPIEWYIGNVFDEETVKKATAGVQYIFHVAAAYREAKIQDIDYWNVHVKSTQLLAAEAAKNPDFKRFVHVSTVGVHGHIQQPPANEEHDFAPGDRYQETKVEGELWIREFGRKNNFPFTVIRPAAILGPGDRRLLKIFRMATKPFFLILGYGKCLYHLIHVDDLADAFILAATHPNALGDYFICGNTEPTTLKEMVAIISETLHVSPRIIRLPVWPFYLLGAACEVVCKPLGIEPPIYRRRVAFYTKDRAFDTRKIRERLGFQPKYDNRRGIAETALWYREHHWLSGSSE